MATPDFASTAIAQQPVGQFRAQACFHIKNAHMLYQGLIVLFRAADLVWAYPSDAPGTEPKISDHQTAG